MEICTIISVTVSALDQHNEALPNFLPIPLQILALFDSNSQLTTVAGSCREPPPLQ